MSDEFSVCQFFRNGAHNYVCRFVSPEEAVRTFKQYTHNVSAQTGLTTRVIITDGGDCINLEWQFKKGIVFPTQEQLNDQG